MTKQYAVVKFIDEDDALGVVHCKWISEDQTSCWYPNVKSDFQRYKLLVSGANTDSTWLPCRIQILHTYGEYTE